MLRRCSAHGDWMHHYSQARDVQEDRDFITAWLFLAAAARSCAPLSFRASSAGRVSPTENRRGLRPASVVALRPALPNKQRQEEETNPAAISPAARRQVRRAMNSGRMPTPVPAIRAGIIASPLFTPSGPDGRTLADLPSLIKRQVSGAF